MEKGCKTKHINVWMVFNKLTQTFHGKFMSLRLTYIKGNLMFYVFPSVGHCIVHMYWVPHNIRQKAYSIIMERFCLDFHVSCFFRVAPFACRNRLSCGTVYYFPPTINIIPAVWFQHIRIKSFHQMNFQGSSLGSIEWRHYI